MVRSVDGVLAKPMNCQVAALSMWSTFPTIKKSRPGAYF